MLRLLKLNIILLKYNNISYKSLVLYKLLLYQNQYIFQKSHDYEYVIFEKYTIKTNKQKIEDDWVEINIHNYDLK